MDNTQQPQQPESFTTPPAPTTTPTPPPAFNPLAESTVSEPRNFLVTFLLAAGYGGILGLRNFYLGQKTIGLVRLGLFVGGYLLIVIGAASQSAVLVSVAALAVLTAYIWMIVDFFVVYLSVKTDAEGQPLTKTNRDAKWAKMFFLITVISIVLMFASGLVVGIAGESFLKKQLNGSSSNSTLELDSNSLFEEDYNFNDNSDSSYHFQTQ